MNIKELGSINDIESLKLDRSANCGRGYQQCSISVLDTISDPDITFNQDGICNYYFDYKAAEENVVFHDEEGLRRLELDMDLIRDSNKGSKYDCILGLSGGVDSTFLCLLAKEYGLNPLVVHCDNGWNSELAQHNIEQTVKKLGFDLYTHVLDWPSFREMQRAYIKSSVVDIEVLTDHAFMAVLYEQARKWKIKFVLAGMNIVTEQVLPPYWIYSKGDDVNIKDIVRKNSSDGEKLLNKFPFLDYSTKKYCTDILKLRVFTPLNYIHYNYNEVKIRIINELGWRDYGGKHYESIWTRFYQGYILPRKFKIDKRKAHLSNLIFSGQITKTEALKSLQTSPYPSEAMLMDDYEFVLKKLGFDHQEFQKLMDKPRKEHTDYKVLKGFWERFPYLKIFRPLVYRVK